VNEPRVEILYFEGCPNHDGARALVARIAAELRVEPKVVLVEVADHDAARDLRFLGSPSIRVNGHDVEPGAQERRDFVYSCRVYRTEQGFSGLPSETWIREAMTNAN